MRKIIITVTHFDHSFISEMTCDEHTLAYQIEDEVFRIALLFAETRVLALYGRMSLDLLGEVLKDIDYDYKEVNA